MQRIPPQNIINNVKLGKHTGKASWNSLYMAQYKKGVG